MSGNKSCMVRLQREYKALIKEPVPNITAHPLPQDMLEWHYVLEGSSGTEYEGGVYHGKIVFPPQYPFKPPSILMLTPNGRFATGTKLCLSMTDYHPESWNPMWSVGTILAGLLSFMTDDQPTTGSISCNEEMKRDFAKGSLAFNVKNSTFRKLFPDWVEEHKRREKEALQGGEGIEKDRLETAGETQDSKEGKGGGMIGEQQQQQQQVDRVNEPREGTGGYGTVLSFLAVAMVIAGLLAVPLVSPDFAV